ncbi:MAG: hypothetical protein IJ412_00455 [Oscillospiraceae bacterium]|nr:hypothetical protein [Oscillospiraceae bacterium]
MIELIKENAGYCLTVDGKRCAVLSAAAGANDTFEEIEDGVWLWRRHTDTPTDHMRMEMTLLGTADFTMVPAISYNGNGWGDTPEYVGDRAEDGTPWSFASHRATIPACTYSENAAVSIALMAQANDNTACSLYRVEEGEKHVLIFPEEEQPKTLHRHFWDGPFQGTMEPRQDFEAIVFAKASDGTRHRYKGLLDFAWRYYGHALKPQMCAKDIYRYSLAFALFLLQKEPNGFTAFTNGAQWLPYLNGYQKLQHCYEVGWVGQNASFAAAFLFDYLKSGNSRSLATGLAADDSWLTHVGEKKFLPARIYYTKTNPEVELPLEKMRREDINPFDFGEAELEGVLDRVGKPKLPRPDAAHDACNLGTGAEGYFEAYDLLKKAGIDKPEYLAAAMDTCNFALESQDESGAFAKSWDKAGEVVSKKGTIGCFLILPLATAYKRTGDEKYLRASVRAFDFYYDELEREGFTTAGALDTYCIDKESASPLLRAALRLYDLTGDRSYVEKAEKVAWYLSTWTMHFTVKYPKDCVINEIGFDTFGSTSVSTAHNALDHFALRDISAFLQLYELTGFEQWKERAIAFWCSACQGISDGTLVVNGRLRPAGSSDEAVSHTRWRRNSTPAFSPTQWLSAWPCACRLEILRWFDDWSFLDEGLAGIAGKIGE